MEARGRMDRVCITEGVKVNIHCPTCDAGYAVIRVRKQPGKTYHRIRELERYLPAPGTI